MRLRLICIPFIPLALAPARLDAASPCRTPVLQWEWDADVEAPAHSLMCTNPMVAQLTDDDLDGDVDDNDTPDVLVRHCGGPCRITALDGVTGTAHFTISDPELRFGELAVGDLDGDGVVEIVMSHRNDQQLVAFDNRGVVKWLSDMYPTAPPLTTRNDPVGIADLDQDGSPEVFAATRVFRADGRLWWREPVVRNGPNLAVAADIDDTRAGMELLYGGRALTADGTPLWDTGHSRGYAAVADFDGDGDPEVVLASSEMVLLDHLGTALGPGHSVDGGWLASPLVDDSSTGVSASAFDFDGDGAAEIVYHDEVGWVILDGATGAEIFTSALPSLTGIEVPVVVDVDRDCVPEILVGGCGDDNRLEVYECADAANARSIWNQYAYHVSNIADDGTVPAVEPKPWLAHNSWHRQSAFVRTIAVDPGAAETVCEGATVTLDGSGTIACGRDTTYRWLDGASELCPASASPACDVIAGATTTYTLEVTCPNGACPAGTERSDFTVTVETAPLVSADAGMATAVCQGDTVLLDASASTCSGMASYRWLDGAVEVCGASADPTCVAAPTADTTYTVEVTCDGAGVCPAAVATADVMVTVDEPPAVAADAGPAQTVCRGDQVTLDASGSTCSGTASYRWLDGVVELCGPSPSPQCEVAPAGSTSYTVEVTCAGAGACPDAVDTAAVAVTVEEPPVALADAGPPQEVCLGDAVTLDASASTCSGTASFRWLDGATEVCGPASDPSCAVSPAATTTFTVEVTCDGGPACPDAVVVDDVVVTVDPAVVPGDLGNSLRGVRDGVDVVFTGAAHPDARSYNLHRGTQKRVWPPLPLLTDLPTPDYRAADVPAPPALYLYRVTGVNCAGVEGP